MKSNHFSFLPHCSSSMPPVRNSYTHHDSPKENRFIGAIQAGMSVAEAAEKENIPLSTAYKIWDKFVLTGSTHSLPCSGRPPKVTEQVERQIVQEAIQNCCAPLSSITNSVATPVSTSTAQNVLAAHGLHQWVAKHVPYLSRRSKYSCYQ